MNSNAFFWKICHIVFAIFFILFPFINYQTFLYGGTSTRSVNLVLMTSLIGLYWGINLLSKKSNLILPRSITYLFIVLYLISITVSGLLGLNFSASFWSAVTRMTGIWYMVVLFVIFVPVLYRVVSDQGRRLSLIVAIIFSTAFYSLLSFLGPEGLNVIFKDYKVDGFTFGNSTFAGMYLFGALLLSIYYIFQAQRKKWWMYILPVILFINPYFLAKGIWFGNFSNGVIGEARASAYVALFALVSLLSIWALSKVKSLKFKTILTYTLFFIYLFAGVFFSVSLLRSDGFIRHKYLDQGTSVRPIVWDISKDVITQRPVFGWGADNFERVFEINYDNRLLEDRYGNEAWLDRAHNIFIDQSVDNGFVGLVFYILIYISVILSLIRVLLKSVDRNDKALSSVLIVYFAFHIIELQTAFDTSISYPMFAFMLAISLVLINKINTKSNADFDGIIVNEKFKYLYASFLVIFLLGTSLWGLIPFIRAQNINGEIRSVGSPAKRIPMYEVLLGSGIDTPTFLWRIATDFQRGIGDNPDVLNNPKYVEDLKKETLIIESEYRKIVSDNPNNFRANLNLADILIYQMLFDVDKLEEAQEVLDHAITLVPNSPQPYWMKAVAYIYMTKFDLAKEFAEKGLQLNPNIKQSQDIVDYVEKSTKNFPNVDLFFFKQI